MKGKSVEIIDLHLVVHSNEMECTKGGRLGLGPRLKYTVIKINLPYYNLFVIFGNRGIDGD